MNRFELLDTAASGMAAQRAALDVAARNVAAAEAAGPKGSYQRAVPVFAIVTGDGEINGDGGTDSGGGTDGDVRVEFAGTRTERGVNVDVLQEMLAVMNASRAYEANTSLFDTGKRLAQQTLDLERS